jgi:hypothetical protein
MLGLTDPPQATVTPSTPVTAPKATHTTDPRLPKSTQEKLPVLLRRIEEVMARARSDDAMTEVSQLARMREDHLEKVLGAYLEVPEEHRGEIYRRTTKSASFHLNDAIDKMAERIEEISRSLADDKINVFSDNASFVMRNYDSNSGNNIENEFLKGLE